MIRKNILSITFLKELELFSARNEKSQFNIGHLFAYVVCSISFIDRTVSGAATPSQSRP